MPYIKVKVSQDLYQELGLTPSMELVRSDSNGSIKFVPLSNKSVFDEYESPLLTSPIFGNRPNSENVTANTSQEPVSSIAVLPSVNVNEVCADKRFKTSQSMDSACSLLFKDDRVKYPTDQLCNDSCQDILSEGKHTADKIIFEEHIDKNPSVLPEREDVDKRHLNQNPVLEVIASVDSSPVEIPSNSNGIGNKVVKYPRECKNCSSVFKTNGGFCKHKKHCKKIKDNKLFGCPKYFWLLEEKPRICEKCGLIF